MNYKYQLCFFLIFICIGIFLYAYYNHKVKVTRFVEATSMRYMGCQILNHEYESHFISFSKVYNHQTTVDSRRKVDAFNFYQELETLLSSSPEIDLEYINNCISSNQHWYNRYRFEYDRLPGYLSQDQFNRIPGKKPHMSYKKYAETERKLRFPLLQPNLSFQVIITVSYTSPKGKSYHECSHIFAIEDCWKCKSDMVRRNRERDYRDEERKKMTPSLRYQILKRDRFRCVICGRGSSDGVTLHVDHIKPVSKGGKTEMSNLRTLCQDCNLGKSNQWEPGGIN